MWRSKYMFLWLIVAIGICFSIAKAMEYRYDENRQFHGYAFHISKHIQDQETIIQSFLEDQAFLNKIYSIDKDSIISDLSLYQQYPFNLCFFQEDQLLYWTKSVAFITPALLENLEVQPVLFKQLSNGYYRVAKHSISTDISPSAYAISFIPIKWIYPTYLEHLKDKFEPLDKEIPDEITIDDKETPFVIQGLDGQHLGYLNADNFTINRVHILSVIFYLLGFILLGFLLNEIALYCNKTNKAWMGPSFLLVIVFGLRYWSLLGNWTERFNQLEIFEGSFFRTNMSIGDVLINIILVLWIVIFIHRHSKANPRSSELQFGIRFILSTMNYLAVILALLLLMTMLKEVVLNSGLPFDFQNVFNFETYSVVAVLSIILLLFSQFIFSHRLMLSIKEFKLPILYRLRALLLATVIVLPIIYFIDLKIPIHFSALIAFIFILAYDIFVDYENPGLVWLVVWIMFFAGFSSGLLNTYNYDKAITEEFEIASALAEENDPYSEDDLVTLNSSLDEIFEVDTTIGNDRIKQLIDQEISKNNYLYKNYDYIMYTPLEYDSIQRQVFQRNLSNRLAAANQLRDTENLYFNSDGKGNYAYLLDYSDYSHFPIVLEFTKAEKAIPTVYSELLSAKGFKKIEGLEKYEYFIYKGEESDKLSAIFTEPIMVGNYDRRSNGGYYDFLYNHDDYTYVLLRTKRNGFFHPVSLFSYIFGLLTLTVLLFAIVNVKLKILPENLNFNIGERTSLKNRIQFSTILLTLMSFVIIAIISVIFLRNNWIDYHDNRLKRKVRSVQRDSEEWLHYKNNSIDFLKTRIPRLAKTHSTDVNLFDLNGNLISSSQEDIYKKGILPPRMNANAFFDFRSFPNKDFYQIDEQISDEIFTTAFVPIKDDDKNRIAYLGVPYYSKQGSLEDEISEFMGSLLTVYVFLLLLAGVFSIFVANSITRPLTAIGEKLQEVKLGKPNTPISWETNDEVGTLITEYNKMIEKLDDSANLLAKSEREGAWREMAKQVAHEIKNPLTPMKLSIQYLKHAFQSNPDNIEPLMQRVSNTLIEQIDNLAHIANEFSNFAKMPRANNQEFVVNDLVESVQSLFKERSDADVLLHLPDRDFNVFADKNQLMRVLNNLIKNAIEAIPDGRRGNIQVSLFEEETMAVIKVSDNGVGIPEEMKSKVFVPNFTTKNSGTGLGLAISKNIIESVNGKIYYETTPNVGTDFFVKLPIEEVAESE